ncbi:hypothetical protein CI752_08790, partial [Klebsiella pneumoniae subsp. pneumoniae]
MTSGVAAPRSARGSSGRYVRSPGLSVRFRFLRRPLKALREGDTLIVWKLDRLGRDLRHL